MFASDQLRQKTKAAVELTLTDGTVLRGNFFLSAQQRVLEAMNDERKFVPFEDADEVVTVVNKSVIARIKPVDQTVEHAKPIPTQIGH